MAQDEEILFGKIALELGYINDQELAGCLADQRSTTEPHLLGTILLHRGIISREELRELLEVQRRLRTRPAVDKPERESDIGFGYTAIQNGYMDQAQVVEAVREQTRMAKKQHLFFRLGEVCVHLGFLTPDQVQKILEFQKRQITRCHSCNKRLDISRIRPGTSLRCPACHTLLSHLNTASSPS